MTAQRLGIDNTPPAEAVRALTRLVDEVLDPLREALGGPIYVTSGYRCRALNRAVGGAAHSQHMRGEAADITTYSREGNARMLALLRQLPVDQVINEHDLQWIHVSYRAPGRRQFLSIP